MTQDAPPKTSRPPRRSVAITDISRAVALDFRPALLAIRDLRETTAAGWSLWVSLLRTQYGMPGHTVTVAQLAKAHRLPTDSGALLSYNKLGHGVADQLGYVPLDRPYGKHEPAWWMTLSTGGEGDDRAIDFALTMHPALAQALELMRWVQPQPAGG